MGQDLPARTVFNGPKTGETGRDARGRLVPGNPGGGRPANPFARQQAQLRQTVLDEVNEADLRAVVRKVLRLAKLGNLAAVELLFKWVIGPPPMPVHPDRVAEDELSVRRGMPTMIDRMLLAGEPGEAPACMPDQAAETGPDPLDPEILALLCPGVGPRARGHLTPGTGELLRLPAAVPPPPPTAAAGWEAFAGSRVEFAPEAAVEVDHLYATYARWAASHGQPVLEEAKVVAWLTNHGATVRTAPLSQYTTVVGVRVNA
jgi:hypothetical protein